MRISAAGNVGIGDTGPTQTLSVKGSRSGLSYVTAITNTNNTAGDSVLAVLGGPNSSDTSTILVGFYDSGGNTTQGTISRNGAAAVAYNTSSDRRVKENIVDTNAVLSTLMQIPV